MESCWEYLGCGKTTCVMHGRKDLHCWEVEGTLCNNHAIEILMARQHATKADACAHAKCLYYEAAHGCERHQGWIE